LVTLCLFLLRGLRFVGSAYVRRAYVCTTYFNDHQMVVMLTKAFYICLLKQMVHLNLRSIWKRFICLRHECVLRIYYEHINMLHITHILPEIVVKTNKEVLTKIYVLTLFRHTWIKCMLFITNTSTTLNGNYLLIFKLNTNNLPTVNGSTL